MASTVPVSVQQANALEELMSTIHEDAELDAERIANKDSKVCKRFLAGLCPYFMLDGTKLGKDNMYKCSKHHDKRLREVYRASVDAGGDDHGYQEMLLNLIEEIVGMIDRRIARDKKVISGDGPKQTIPQHVQDAIDDIEAEVHNHCFLFFPQYFLYFPVELLPHSIFFSHFRLSVPNVLSRFNC